MTRGSGAEPDEDAAAAPPRSAASLALAGVVAALAVAALVALGVWQVHRLSWKRDLIARVERRIHAAPAPLPLPAAWPGITAAADEYRRVEASGRFENDRETLVQAVTEEGAGFWVVTPLRTDSGVVLVNRGFVPPERRDPATRAAGQVEGAVHVAGLLRLSEPNGAFLRRNDPGADRWFSRDVAAVAAARRLGPVAPFFIDADATPNPGGLPVGGLTVVRFPDNHLVYAVTWFSLAALLAGATVWALRAETRRLGPRRRGPAAGPA